MSIDLTPWTEKYRPKTIEEFVFPIDFNQHDIEKFKSYVNNRYIDQNYIFYGRGGTGKTTLANILIKQITGNNPRNYYRVTGRRIDDIDELKKWIKTSPINSKVKIVVIEEIDRLSQKAITELKSIIEDANRLRTYFIGLTNRLDYLQNIDPHFLQRFIIKKFNKLPPDKVADFVIRIFENEKVSNYDNHEVKKYVEKFIVDLNKSLRDIIQIFQYSVNPATREFNRDIIENIIETELGYSSSTPEVYSVESEIISKINQFISVLDTIYTPKLLGLFITTFNLSKLEKTLTDAINLKPKLKPKYAPLLKLIKTYKEIENLVHYAESKKVKINYKHIYENLISKYERNNPMYTSIFYKNYINVDTTLFPENILMSMLYELTNIKFEILKSAASNSIEEVLNEVIKELKK